MKRAFFAIACNYRGNRSMRELNVGRDLVGLGGFFEHVAGYDIFEIVQDQPKQVVLAKLDDVLSQLSAGDLLVIYFGGHGIQRIEDLLILPTDPSDPAAAPFGFLAVSELRRRTENLVRAIILDCCRNDDAQADSVVAAATEYSRRAHVEGLAIRDIDSESTAAAPRASGQGSHAIFHACSDDDVAPELGQTGKGLFSTAMLNVLKSAHRAGQRVRIDDHLRELVEEEMNRLAKQYGVPHTPKPWKAGNGTPEVLGGSTDLQDATDGIPQNEEELSDPSVMRAEQHETAQRVEVERKRRAVEQAETQARFTHLADLNAALASFIECKQWVQAKDTCDELLRLKVDDPSLTETRAFIEQRLPNKLTREGIAITAKLRSARKRFWSYIGICAFGGTIALALLGMLLGYGAGAGWGATASESTVTPSSNPLLSSTAIIAVWIAYFVFILGLVAGCIYAIIAIRRDIKGISIFDFSGRFSVFRKHTARSIVIMLILVAICASTWLLCVVVALPTILFVRSFSSPIQGLIDMACSGSIVGFLGGSCIGLTIQLRRRSHKKLAQM